MPFSFFILVPGAEILLPPFLMIFPNAKPSQWANDEEREKKFLELKARKHAAGTKLLLMIPQKLNKLRHDTALDPSDLDQVKKLRELMNSEYMLPTDLLSYRGLFRKYLDFYRFEPKVQMNMFHFLTMDPVTGFNTVNRILGFIPFVKLGIEFQSNPWLKPFLQIILGRQLQLRFKNLRNADEYLHFEELDVLTEEKLDSICFVRGINLDQDKCSKLADLKLWLSISNLRDVDSSLLLFSRIKDFV